MSIRNKLLLALLLFCGLTAAVGAFALREIKQTSKLTVETYNKPLMAINFARSAQVAFASMEKMAARAYAGGPKVPGADPVGAIDRLYGLFREDLGIARERAQSPDAVATIAGILDRVEGWNKYRRTAGRDGIDVSEWLELDRRSENIVDQFDFLIDLIAGDGFVLRQDAVDTIQSLNRSVIFAVGGIAGIGILIAFALSRSISVPLRQAVTAAERISRGEFTAEIPQAGRHEMGVLLRSMSAMQRNLERLMSREEALRKSAQLRLIDAIENSPEGIVLLDSDHRIVVANTQIGTFFPAIADRFTSGIKFVELLSIAARQGVIAASSRTELEICCRSVGTTGRTVSDIELSGGRWLRLSFSPARDQGIVIVCGDITDMIRREEQLRLAKDEAETANQAKSSFLANMSHELRTPLNAVIGFSDILKAEMLGPIGNAKYRAYAADIYDSGTHLLRVINDILDLSKIEAGKMVPDFREVDPGGCMEASLRIIQGRASEQDIEISTRIEDAIGTVYADERMLKQVFMNLLSNAIKFSPARSKVEISVSRNAADELVTEIRDSGIGMTPEEIQIACEPFGQVDSAIDRKYEGTGLGLPLTKRIVELHNGTLTLQSEPGSGTTATVILPPLAPEGKEFGRARIMEVAGGA